MKKSQPELPFVIDQVAMRQKVREVTKAANGLVKISIYRIHIRPQFNARIRPEGIPDELYEQMLGIPQLADGIFESNGPADPIQGDILPNGNFYQTDGERRIRALRHLLRTDRIAYPNGQLVEEVRVLLNPPGTTELDRQIKVVTTNEHLPLKSMERAHFYVKMIADNNLTHDQLAQRLQVSRQTINNYVKATTLASEMQEAIDTGKISMADALKTIRKTRQKDDIDEEVFTTNSSPVAKDLDGDENEFGQQDNTKTFPGSMSGPKEESGSAVAKDGIYMAEQRKALWRQLLHRVGELREAKIVNATEDEVKQADEEIIEILGKEFNLTLR